MVAVLALDIVLACMIPVAGVVGHFEGYLMGTKVKNLQNVPEPEQEVETRDCLCEHKIVHHTLNGVTGKRGACVVAKRWDEEAKKYQAKCACSGYVPEPMKPDLRVIKGELDL